MSSRPGHASCTIRGRSGFHGAFPAARVEADVKGTSAVIAHGIPGMMIWGATFPADADGNQGVADARIADLVQFIESIQRKR